jgi:Pyruvate/2-oxoacid:ferredoxin oxidoreductase delta subunit
VLYEGQGSEPLGFAQRLEVMRGLLEKGYAVANVREVGHVGTDGAAALAVLGNFAADRAPSEDWTTGVKLFFHNIANATFARVLELVDAARQAVQAPKPGGWKPWFPVIDYKRCTNCMQCLSFCLFDVYSVDPAGQIKVQNETKCKTDCPACSRVCPEVAILFPKYRHGPINGDEINNEDVRREALKVDISALLGGDIYAALRDRSAKAKSRFSAERDEGKALAERMKCFAKLQEGLDIPPEVLASLPSIDQIQIKAQAAKARGEAALAANAATAQTA